jgi:lipopolysaccharide export system protein LptA
MKRISIASMVLICALGAAQAQDASSSSHTNGIAVLGGSKCNGLINVASDSFEGNFDTKVGTYVGNVVVTQSACKLRADKIVAEAAAGNNLDRLTASGNVVFDSASGVATGDQGIYDLGQHTVTMRGKVILTKGKDVMRGNLLVVDMNSGLAHLTANRRVESVFAPNQRNGAPAPAKPKDDATN